MIFRGGLQLYSSDRDFGGLSGLLVSADGKTFVAISDEAHWVTGTLRYQNGNLAGAEGGTIAPYLDLDGNPLVDKIGDAEGLASGDGVTFDDLFISFEQKHRIWRYAFGKNGVGAVPVNVPVPDKILEAAPNGGLEGITRIDDGMLLAVSEHFANEAGNYRAWLIPFDAPKAAPRPRAEMLFANGDDPHAVEIAVAPRHPFAMTDVRRLPDGSVLTLERRFDTVHGIGVELRRVRWTDVQKAAGVGSAPPLDGELVATFDQSDAADNMEGLSVRRGPHGETFVYMISDDNFNTPLQRTLLWMFELID